MIHPNVAQRSDNERMRKDIRPKHIHMTWLHIRKYLFLDNSNGPSAFPTIRFFHW